MSDLTPRDYAEAGYSIREMAEDIGIPYDTAYTRAVRSGACFKLEFDRDWRDRIETMTATQAVDYLADLLTVAEDALLGERTVPQYGMRRTAWAVFCALRRAGPRGMTHEQIVTVCEMTTGHTYIQAKNAQVQICHIRRLLPASVGCIETLWGNGYRFLPAEASA